MIDSFLNWLFGDIWVVFLVFGVLMYFAFHLLMNSKELQGGVLSLLKRLMGK